MTDVKNPLASRTVWANLIGLACVLLGLFGIDTGGIETDRLAEALAQVAAAVSFVASTVFRVVATKELRG